MRTSKLYFMSVLAALCFGCDDDKDSQVEPVQSFTYTFEQGTEGWEGGFTDYPKDWDPEQLEFRFAHENLPAEVNKPEKALLVSGRNSSDDLFMFIKKQLTGLQPNHTYVVTFQIELASQYPETSAGIGGSPGASVYLKAGGSTTEPLPVEIGEDIRLNLDKGNQAQGGEEMVVLGTVGIPGDEFRYQLIERDNQEDPVQITTDSSGSLWIIVGTDSGFEGTSTLYYNTIKVELKSKES